jgi:hypothetical protein
MARVYIFYPPLAVVSAFQQSSQLQFVSKAQENRIHGKENHEA